MARWVDKTIKKCLCPFRLICMGMEEFKNNGKTDWEKICKYMLPIYTPANISGRAKNMYKKKGSILEVGCPRMPFR